MRRNYFLYILILFSILLASLVVWPSKWINLDIGSFHYHKLWENPNLSELTFGLLDFTPAFDLGRDFIGGSEYKLKVVFDEDGDNLDKVSETVGLLRKRLEEAGFTESAVRSQKQGDDYFIFVQIGRKQEDFEQYKQLITEKGKLEIWGEKDEEMKIQIGDESIEIVPDEDPFRQFLKQQYSDLGINGNEVKGTKVGEDEEGIFIKVALNDEESEKLTNTIISYYGKSIIGILDGQALPIDGSELGEQLGVYRGVKTIKFVGILDEKQGRVYTAMIEYGPLEVECEIEESSDLEPVFGMDFLKRGIILAISAVFVLSVLFIIMFKWDGVFGAFLLLLYSLFILVLLKALPVRITIGSLGALIISFGVFVGLLWLTLRSIVRNKEKLSSIYFARDKEISCLARDVLCIKILFAAVFLVIASSQVKYFASVILIGAVLGLFVLEVILSSIYKLVVTLVRQG